MRKDKFRDKFNSIHGYGALEEASSITDVDALIYCSHGIRIDTYECSLCMALAEVESYPRVSRQLNFYDTNSTYTVPQKIKSLLSDEQKTDILRQSIETITGFKGDIYSQVLTKPKTYILQGEGMWCSADRPFARLVAKISDTKYPGEYNVLENSFDYKLPLIPGSFLTQILSFFRHYVVDEGIKNVTEAMTQIYWDPVDNEYFIHIPKQEVTGAHVTYLFTDADPRIRQHNCCKVWDIHSHNTMSSFFSGVDDSDEQGQQFYGVIGNITANSHSWSFRMGVDGHWAPIESDLSVPGAAMSALFDMSSFTETGTYPAEWLKRVSFEKFNDNLIAATPGYKDYHNWGHDNNHSYYDDYNIRWGNYSSYNHQDRAASPVRDSIDQFLAIISRDEDIQYLAKGIVADRYCTKMVKAIIKAFKAFYNSDKILANTETIVNEFGNEEKK